MSFEPERPAKRRKIDESCEGPEVRPLPYMACARINSHFIPGNSREFFVRNLSCLLSFLHRR